MINRGYSNLVIILTKRIIGEETPTAAMAVPIMRICTVRDLRTPKSKKGTFSIAGFLSLALDLEFQQNIIDSSEFRWVRLDLNLNWAAVIAVLSGRRRSEVSVAGWPPIREQCVRPFRARIPRRVSTTRGWPASAPPESQCELDLSADEPIDRDADLMGLTMDHTQGRRTDIASSFTSSACFSDGE